jgi:hypothetical protein
MAMTPTINTYSKYLGKMKYMIDGSKAMMLTIINLLITNVGWFSFFYENQPILALT